MGGGTHLQTAEQTELADPCTLCCQHPPGQELPPSRGTGDTCEGTQGSKERMNKLCQAQQDQVAHLLVEGVKEIRTRDEVQ